MKVSKHTLKLIACVAALGFAAPGFAQTFTDNMATTVSVTFTPKCAFNSAAGTLTLSTSYTAFQTGAATASASPTVNCSRGITVPTFGFSGTATPPGSYSASPVTYSKTVAGLAYTLTATPATLTDGTAASGSTGATAAAGTVALGLSIPGLQPGDSGASTTDVSYLYVSF